MKRYWQLLLGLALGLTLGLMWKPYTIHVTDVIDFGSMSAEPEATALIRMNRITGNTSTAFVGFMGNSAWRPVED